MRPHTLIGWCVSLALPGLLAACINATEVTKPQTPDSTAVSAPVSMSVAVQGHLKQYILTQRNIFSSDFTYDTKGRQASVWTYNQRSGEGKDDMPQTVFTYDAQNRLQKIEEGRFSTDPATGNAVALEVVRRCELAYEGLTVTARTTVAPASTGSSLETVYELNKTGHIVKQTQRFADGSKNKRVYVYANDNVIQQDVTITDASGAITSRARDTYEYDTSQNPLRGLISQGGLIDVQTYSSRNNLVRSKSQNLSPADPAVIESTNEATYQYTFANSGLPVSYQAGTVSGTFVYD
ncbi:hypothetical protein [Spirosoma fluminis]